MEECWRNKVTRRHMSKLDAGMIYKYLISTISLSFILSTFKVIIKKIYKRLFNL